MRCTLIKIYGSMLCPDCVACRKALDAAKIEYSYLDFSEDLRNLKEFLKLRDGLNMFDSVRETGKIGIPAIVMPNGDVIFDWEILLNK